MSHEITLIKLYIYGFDHNWKSRITVLYNWTDDNKSNDLGGPISHEPTGAMVKRCTVPVLGMAVNPILLWVIHNAMNHPWLGIVFLMVYTCLIMFIPPIKIVIFLGDGLWHCFTDLTSHYIPFKQHFLWSTDHVFCPIPVLPCVAHLLAPAVGDLPDGVRQPRCYQWTDGPYFANPPRIQEKEK